MPKINKSAQEQSTDSPLDQVVSTIGADIAITTSPVLICGVNRKINIGNFENIDVYAGIALPMPNQSLDNMEELSNAVQEAAAYGFSLVSKETGERYLLIKESQQNK